MLISSVFVLRRRRGEMQKIVRCYMELIKIEKKFICLYFCNYVFRLRASSEINSKFEIVQGVVPLIFSPKIVDVFDF